MNHLFTYNEVSDICLLLLLGAS